MNPSRNLRHQKKKIPVRKAMLLVGREHIGGAEKRYGRVFLYASARDTNLFLIINQVLYESLLKHGIRLDKSKNVFLITGNHYANPSFAHMMLSGLRLYHIVARLIDRHNINQLHSMGFLFLLNALLFLRKKKVYKGFSIFDSTLDQNLNSGALRALFKSAVKNSDYVEFLSDEIKESFLKRYGDIFNGNYFVAPCSFIDYSRCEPTGVGKKNRIVFMGRLIKDKNPSLLLKAVPSVLRHLGDKHKDIDFCIVGDGPLLKSLKEQVEQLRIENHVTFMHCYAPERLLWESKIFVSLQEVNNYPSQSLIEAMACENAIIATDVGETWKLVDETVGVRVGKSCEDIATAIIALFENPNKLTILGKNARQKVLREHTIGRYVDYFTRCLSRD